MKWSYSRYRATLKRDGKFFAIVTPDGKNALSKDDAATLLNILNRPCGIGKTITSGPDSKFLNELEVLYKHPSCCVADTRRMLGVTDGRSPN